MKKFKSNLDEMQELSLLKIEKTGFWLTYIGLAAVIVVQMLIYQGDSMRYTAGEMIILLFGCIYVVAASIRKGIWSRRIPATPMANLVHSMLWSGIFGIVIAVIKYVQYGTLAGAIATGVVFFISLTIFCFIVLSVLMACYKKKRNDLEKEDEE